LLALFIGFLLLNWVFLVCFVFWLHYGLPMALLFGALFCLSINTSDDIFCSNVFFVRVIFSFSVCFFGSAFLTLVI